MTLPTAQPPVQPAQPAPPAPVEQQPPAPGAPGTITIQQPEPGTQPPFAAPAPAVDQNGVWAQGIQAPPGIAVNPPGAPVAPAPIIDPAAGYVDIGGQRFFSQQQIEQARSEERNKMHTRVETVEQELQRLRAEREQDLAAEREKAAQEAAEAERQRLAGLSGEERINETVTRLEQTVTELQSQRARDAAVFQQEQRLRDLENYRSRRLAEEQDLIHPTLVDFVTGNSEDEIEQSITNLKARTDAIVQDLQAGQVAARQQMRGVAPTGAPPVMPSEQAPGQQTLTADDIAKMTPAEYAANRQALMAAVSQQAASGGLYR